MKTIVGNSITVNKSIEKANNIKAKSKIKFKGGYVKWNQVIISYCFYLLTWCFGSDIGGV